MNKSFETYKLAYWKMFFESIEKTDFLRKSGHIFTFNELKKTLENIIYIENDNLIEETSGTLEYPKRLTEFISEVETKSTLSFNEIIHLLDIQIGNITKN